MFETFAVIETEPGCNNCFWQLWKLFPKAENDLVRSQIAHRF